MTKLTPMMAQYKEIKSQHQDSILMFRLGDFYEMFFEDALTASKILQITLTARGKGESERVPMCGVPHHAVSNYIAKLTKAGKKVALCDQLTEPDGKGIVERNVIRIITPGTTFDENILDQKTNNYVCSIVADKEGFALAYADITTGSFFTTEIKNLKDLESELIKINPAECILSEELMNKLSATLKKMPNLYFFKYEYLKDAESDLKQHFQIHSLDIFGLNNKKLGILVSGMLFNYLKETQKTQLTHIQKISYYEVSKFMPLDESCIRNLELFFTSRENKKEGSLIWVLDQTVNPMGGRLLRNWLLNPLIEKSQIDSRLNKVEIFVKNSSLLRDMREILEQIYDIERLLSKLSLGAGNARDLIAMKQCLSMLPSLKALIDPNIPGVSGEIEILNNLVELIERSINEEAPLSVRDGGIIKSGFNAELDDLRKISTEGKTFIKDLQEKEIQRTGISSLKVKYNQVFGYYIEISKANLKNFSLPEGYIRKQTLVNAERFITPELKEYEEKVLNAEDRIKELEFDLFYQVRMEVVKEIVRLQKIARAIAELDVLSSLAYVAVKNNYCKPEIFENATLEIIEGRHPVVEKLSENFVPNDCLFSKNFLLITGPNMGGKSTYLRQVALITLLAHIGSYVPAKAAKISLVDKIFTRVGASDNLSRGESTFMVEMQEAAYILNNATEKSLIILDEIGRGTSTYDGVSIAWAMSEFIHDKTRAKTLFATHYHELIELADKMENASNLSAAVKENEKEGVVFLYKIIEGGVDKSYGIEVAKLAGLPIDVVSRARGVLTELETKHIKKTPINPDQMGLFAENEARKQRAIETEKVLGELKEIDINKITPLEAMQKLQEIKNKAS